MRPLTTLVVLICALMFFSARKALGQTCTGSLGDPVINETFGAGATYGTGPALPAGVTTVKYTTETCPGDGFYTIASSLGTCFGGTWEVVPHDHTGDKNGYMMIINASYDPGIFYVQKARGDLLCPNTTYEFAAYIMNVMRDLPNTKGFIEPNITFRIETTDGKLLAPPYTTGNIPQADDGNNTPRDGKFRKFGMFFTSPSDGSDVVVKMINNAPGGNGNDLILDDITFRPCGPVIEVGFGGLGATGDINFCEGSVGTKTFHLVSHQDGYNDAYYQWQVNKNDGSGWVDIAGATHDNVDITLNEPPVGKYQYRVGILNGPGAALSCRIYSQPLNVVVNPLPAVKIDPETKICAGKELRLNAEGGTSYNWTGPNGYRSDKQSPVLSYTADPSFNGVYEVTVTTAEGCSAKGSTTVTVLPAITPGISGDVIICKGSATQLSASGGTHYKWTPSTGLDHDDIAQPIASPSVTTTYHVKIDNGACTDETQQVTVQVLALPQANAGKDLAIQEGDFVKLNGIVGGDNVHYYWTPSDDMDDPLSATPTVHPTDNITYTLHVESLSGCGDVSDDVFVRVYKKITIPNTFSPNADGINDNWDIDKLDTYPEATVKVFTRGGKMVYQSIGYGKPWAGSYAGKQLPAGVYYYAIDLKNGTPLRSGWVLLVR